MNIDIINNISNIILLVHTLVLYPVFKFAINIDRRLTILETQSKN